MSALYEKLIRPALFTQEAEKMHEYALILLKILGATAPLCRAMEAFNQVKTSQPVELFGLEFPNRVGLAAGFDKNAECLRSMACFGFGHLEIGTVTRHKQPGNARPRLFRYPPQEVIVNRMGFNNDGAEAVAQRMSKFTPPGKRRIPIGVNIGKTKKVPLEEAVEDYLGSFSLLADFADYFTINISSPNTPELRKLQGKDHLPELLDALHQANADRARKLGTGRIPMLVKIAPDLTFSEIDEILGTILDKEIDGIIATNTTVERTGNCAKITESGGLSGKPLHKRATQIIKYISGSTEGKLPIIGVGGIDDSISAGAALDAGASLVQVYTGLVYKGPFLPRDIAKGLAWSHNDWV